MDLNETRVCSSLDQDVDHVSNLPDAILCHILSYLPTKYSVRTRILSTRWKYLFTLVPVLEFYSPSHCLAWTTVKPFLDFVNFVLSSYNVDCMDRFHYFSSSFLPESEAPRLVSWIHDSVNRRVRELIINEDLNTPVTFPCNTFLSQSLAVLKIMGRFNLDVPENVFLPRLKTFHLLSVVFNDDYSVRRLFQSCPVLKVLVLEYCSSKNIDVIEICVPSLVKLKISGFKDEFALVLDVPNVKYFEYRGSESEGFSVRCGLKSLVNACVSFPTWSDAGFEALPKLVSIVSHVRRLKICASTLEAFRGFGHTLPTFHNLTNLEMKISTVLGFDQRILIDFLDKAPRLDVLVLDGGCSSEFEPSDKVPEHVPTCVSTHLKLIEFQGVSMLVYERTLVEYFLKNARVLEIFYIQLKGSLEKQFEMNKKLLTISRCSKACQIFVDSVDDGSR